jgi:hypothetical protein
MLEDFGTCRTKLPGFEKTSAGMLESPWEAYDTIAYDFAQRDIGFNNDKLRAFRGLENYLMPSLTRNFIFGLPQIHFDAAISWYRTSPRFSHRISTFPSWTWLGTYNC